MLIKTGIKYDKDPSGSDSSSTFDKKSFNCNLVITDNQFKIRKINLGHISIWNDKINAV